MNQPPLPLAEPFLCIDVLIMLFDLLDQRRHVQALMQTCKALYYTGMKHLLRFGAEIHCASKLLSFGQFMHNDLDTRPLLLTRLIVRVPLAISVDDPDDDTDSDNEFFVSDCEDPEGDQNVVKDPAEDDRDTDSDSGSSTTDSLSTEAIQLLAPILRKATRLEYISIDFFEEVLERDEEALDEAFSSLPALRYLRMTSFGVRTLWLLPRFVASLVEVDINFYYDGISSAPDALQILSPFASSLEKISLWWADLSDVHVGLHHSTVRFPRVRTLSLRNYMYWSGRVLPTLLHCFPNLRTLLAGDFQEGNSWDTVYAMHVRNRAVSDLRSFSQLTHLSGDMPGLYVLGITRQVRRVDITHVVLCNCAPAVVRTILQGPGPTHLHLHVGYVYEHDPMHEEDISLLPDLLAYPGAGAITHLGLDVSTEFVQDAHDFAANIMRTASRLPRLTFLIVRSQTESIEDLYEGESPCRRVRSAPWSILLQWHKRAKELAKGVHTLQFLVFDLAGIPQTYWRIVRNGDDVSLRGIEIAEGLEVVKAEGMEYHHMRQPPLYPEDYPPGFDEEVVEE